MRYPRPASEHEIPLPDPDESVPVSPIDYEEFTSPSRWFWLPVGVSGAETFIRSTLIEQERLLRRRFLS